MRESYKILDFWPPHSRQGNFMAHQSDIAFSFRSFMIIDKMIIPGGRPWLDKIATES